MRGVSRFYFSCCKIVFGWIRPVVISAVVENVPEYLPHVAGIPFNMVTRPEKEKYGSCII